VDRGQFNPAHGGEFGSATKNCGQVEPFVFGNAGQGFVPDCIGLQSKTILQILDAVFNQRVAFESAVTLGYVFSANVFVDVSDLIAIQELALAQLFPCLYGF
jgi:hypothetical protein